MKKQELLKAVAEKANTTQSQANDVINALQDVIIDLLDDSVHPVDHVSLPKLGTFKVKYTKERQGVNPSTGEKIVIGANQKIVFKALPSLKKHC